MSVGEFADALPVSRAAVYQWEYDASDKHASTPTTKHIADMAALLGVSVHEFYGDIPKKRKTASRASRQSTKGA